jgi:radical SAM superfamily enzyme YgiQ (UPF0313 family)
MHYEGNMIRPPSEANSILLQATVGCSHNKCAFCGTYRGERFKIKSDEIIMSDIAFAARHCRRQRRVFICDGDALVIPQKRLVPMLEAIQSQLPWVTRVGTYATAQNLAVKTLAELEALRDLGLGIIYLGLESGDDETLAAINKGVDADEMIAMGRKVKAAGIKLSVTVLLGIAGRKRSQEHARATAEVLSAMDPEYIGALSLILVPGTPMYEANRTGKFSMMEPLELLGELRTMFASTELTKGQFHANHASNYLPIRARLPKDKTAVLSLIDQALEGRVGLKPEWMRGL